MFIYRKYKTPKPFKIIINRHWIAEKKGKISVVRIWFYWFELRFYCN